MKEKYKLINKPNNNQNVKIMKTINTIKLILIFIFSVFYSSSFAQNNSAITQTVCVGTTENYRVDNTNSNDFEWELATPAANTLDSLFDINSDDDSVRIQWNTVGTYTLKVIEKDDNGCEGLPVQLSVTVVPLPTVAAGTSSPTNEVCIGDSIQIQAAGALTYYWDNGAVLANDSVSPSTNTTYTVVGTDGNGCENTASVSIAVNALPTVAAGTSSPTNEVCIGDSIQIQAAGALTYYWDNGAVLANDSVSPSTNTTYTVVGTDGNGCENTASVSIAVNALPNVQIANPSAVCLGNSVSLQANGALSYLWSNSSVGSNITVTPTLTQSTYSVTGTDGNGCKNTDSINVTVNQLPSTGPIFHN